MKKILLLTLIATVASFGSLAIADDVTISIAKAGEHKATVATFPDGKNSSVVPITFSCGASWDSVKDSYIVSSESAADLAAGKACVTVADDGTISLKKATCSAKKEDSKTPAKK